MKLGDLAKILGVNKTEVYGWLREGIIIYEVSRRSGINFLALMEETGYEFEKLVNFYLAGSIDDATKYVRRKRDQKIRRSDVEAAKPIQDSDEVRDSGEPQAESLAARIFKK